MNWLPISTVPLDGREIMLGWIPNWPVVEYEARSCWKRGRWDGDYSEPTHWRTLYAPPVDEAKG